MCETVGQTGVGGTRESCSHLYGFACLLARILFPTRSLFCHNSLSPCLLLFQCWSGSRLLQYSTLWFITSSWLQHHRHLKDGLRNSVSLKRAAFILDLSLWGTVRWNTTLLGWLHTLPTLKFPVASRNYWNHVWCFKTAGGQVYASHEGTLVSQWDASFRPGGGWIGLMEKQMCWHIKSPGRAVRWLLDMCVSEWTHNTQGSNPVSLCLSACFPITRQGQGCSAAVPSPPLNTLIPKSLLTLWRHKSPAIPRHHI